MSRQIGIYFIFSNTLKFLSMTSSVGCATIQIMTQRHASFLIKPASSLCNLRCTYCFYHDVSAHRMNASYGLMSKETMNTLIDQSVGALDHAKITFAFQGGEPTVWGLDNFKAFVESTHRYADRHNTIHWAIQTNGTLIDDDWIAFFKEHHFLVGLSIDGPRRNHDHFRITAHGLPTHDRVLQTAKRLRDAGVDFNVLTVLTKTLAKQPESVYRFYKQHGFTHVQLIPCLPGFDQTEDPFALTPEGFAHFYTHFYALWLEDYRKGHYLSVGLLDDLIPMFAGVPPMMCGMLGHCAPQYVIEADGSVYPCDFYVLDTYRCGNVHTHTFNDILRSEPMQRFLKEPKRMSPLCSDCPFSAMCHGNCKRLNITYFDEQRCGYREFLTQAAPTMRQIAAQLQKKST
jgi:uncharacterized protein